MPVRRSTWVQLSLVPAVVAAGVFLGRLVGARPAGRQPAAERPSISVEADPATLSFGTAWATDRFEWQIRLTNTAATAVVLEELSGDCSCATVDGLPVAIDPGQHVSVRLTLDLTRWMPDDITESREYRLELRGRCQTGSERAQVRWLLGGVVRTSVRVEPGVIDFGLQSVRAGRIERHVTVRTAPEVTGIAAEPPPGWRAEVTRPEPTRFVLTLRPDGEPKIGPVAGVVQLRPTSGHDRIPNRTITVRGEVVRDALPDPRSMFFGRVPVGGSRDEVVRFRSVTGGTFRVTGSSSSTPAVSVAAVEGDRTAFAVRVAPLADGPASATVTFDIEEGPGRTYPVVVPVAYHGEPAGGGR